MNRRTLPLFGDEPAITSRNNTIPAGLAVGDYFVGVILESDGDIDPGANVSAGLPIKVTATAGASAQHAAADNNRRDSPRVQLSDNPAPPGDRPGVREFR